MNALKFMFKFKIIFLISIKHVSVVHYVYLLYILTLNCNERKDLKQISFSFLVNKYIAFKDFEFHDYGFTFNHSLVHSLVHLIGEIKLS